MIDEAEAKPLGDRSLQSLQFGIDEFDHFPSFNVDHMVVMRVWCRLISGFAVSKIVPLDDARLLE